MKRALRGVAVLGLLLALAAIVSAARSTTPLASRAWLPSLSMTAAAREAAPDAPETSVEAAKTGGGTTGAAKTEEVKTGAAKTDAAKTDAAAEAKPDTNLASWAKLREYAVALATYPLTIALAILILSYVLARVLSQRLRMPDFSWKIGLVAFTVVASVYISWVGISNAIYRARTHQTPSGAELKFGIDLRGGVNLVYQIKNEGEQQPTEGGKPRPNEKSVDANALIDALRKRIDPNGTKQIVVRLSGADQVDIVVPDVTEGEVAEIKRSVTDLGTLEFRILAHRSKHLTEGKAALALPATKREVKLYPDDPDSGVQARWVPIDPDISGFESYYSPRKDEDGANADDGLFSRALHGSELAPKNTPVSDMLEPKPEGGLKYKDNYRAEILVFEDKYNVKGDFLNGVGASIDERGNPAVSFSFDSEGANRFTNLTTEFQPPEPNKPFKWHLAVVLNGYVTSAPTLNSVIGAHGQISGYRSDERGRKERDRVIAVLKAGQLPAQLYETPLREFRMDATLGVDTILKSVWSMVVALGLVFLFMLVYYRFSGVVACIALLLNTLLLVAAMIAIGAALTLPGFAGMVLSIGMAVDTNVLIYERMREELARGAALRMAIRNGFGKALSAIIDSHITTIITSLILFYIGTEQLKGFAVTLILGLVINLYTAVFCSRLMFDIVERRRWLTDIRMMKFFGKTSFDFLRVKWAALAFSWAIILVGMVAVYARGKGLLDIDFTGGTAAQVVFKDPEKSEVGPVRKRLEEWNNSIDPATSPSSLQQALELKSEPKNKLIRTLQIELLDRLVKEGKRSEVTQAEVDALKQRHRMAGEGLTQADEERLDKFYASLTEDETRQYRSLAKLPDLTVTVTNVPITDDDGTTRSQRRPLVNTSNSSAPAVEGVLEKVFEGDLASNSFREGYPKLIKAPGPAGKGPPAEPDKPPAGAAEKTKVESGKTGPPKTEPAKGEPGKTEPPKKAPAKTSALTPWGTEYSVAAVADDDRLLLAQADAPKKTTEAKSKSSAAEAGGAEDSPAKTPAEKAKEDGAATGLPEPVTFEVEFVDKINHDVVVGVVRRAARDQKLSDAAVQGVTATNLNYDPQINQGFETWTVSINAPVSQARAVLDEANRLIRAQPFFPASNNFGSLVSDQMRLQALIAIVASWLAMMVYLWIRFQRVSFGLGALVALVHDSLVALAFMAFSYWMTWIPTVDPFKINLDVVAAFLTLIGYSVMDTIVIFDRIREIKGKSPELTPEMVNRAVNETLSRTIITAGLTFLVVLAQYFFGGESIHAFAYCLLVGLIIGTYSSVYIAAPVMLWVNDWGRKKGRTRPAPARESQTA